MLPATIRRRGSVPVLLGVALFAHTPLAAQVSERGMTIQRVDRAPKLEDFLGGAPPPVAVPNGSADGARDANGAGTPLPPGVTVVVTDFRQREPGDGDPVSQPTTAYLSYDDANLYVVFVCRDEPGKVRGNIARREDIDEDDQVLLYLDTFQDGKRAYLFVANPLGVQQDGLRTEGQDEDWTWDAIWTSEGQLTENGYVVRMAIPFRSLRFARRADQTWGIALGRIVRRNNEESYWPHLTKRRKGIIPQFGTLEGLSQISPGRNAQANPYYVMAGSREFDDDIPGYGTLREERLGVDAKLVLADAITVDGTLHPDFSQVESDDPQVTLNKRFEVFFDEKRPFFLENAGYFQTSNDLFFSRRIIEPGVGLRMTGKAGPFAIGALAINDRAAVEEDELPMGEDAWIGALRLQYEFGKESTVGLLATTREFLKSYRSDHLGSIDARWRIGMNWTLEGQATASENKSHDALVETSGWGLRADVSRSGRSFDLSSKYEEFSPEFNAALGAVKRVGFREVKHSAEYAFRPDGMVTQFGPALSASWLWDHVTGQLLDREYEAGLSLELKGKTKLQFVRVDALEVFEGLRFLPYTNEASFRTELLKWLAFDVSYAWGAAVNHDPAENPVTEEPYAPSLERATETQAEFIFRPISQLRVDQAYNYSALLTRAGLRPIVAEHQLRSKLNYQFNRALSLRAIVDYTFQKSDVTQVDENDPDQREFGIDLLLTYFVHPGTALYVGVLDNYENLARVRGALPGDPDEVIRQRRRFPRLSVERQIFVKLSYLWRF